MAGPPPTLAELLARAQESRLSDVYTALPGIVQDYDPSTQTADVLPAIQRAIGTLEDDIAYEDLPIVPNVKICFPRGGAFQISWPINKGDSVILVVTTYSISQWRQGDNSQTVPPGDLRLHHVGSAFALPMLATDGNAIPNNQASQNAFIISGPLIVLGDPAATDFAALASKCDGNFNKIKALFNGWTPVPNDGGAALKTASASLNFDPTACEKVKIK